MKSAVLFLVFNRPDTTREVLSRIAAAKPPRLYIAADGPRKDSPGEEQRCCETREIATKINWPCEVKTLFRDKNLGCGRAVSEAIDWFFEHEDEGIILEDDTVPELSFFEFCEELLDYYREDNRVWHIGGYVYKGLEGGPYSYNFTRFTHVWGWATWKRAWRHYDYSLQKFKEYRSELNDLDFFYAPELYQDRVKLYERILSGDLDTWDYQWNFTVRINNGMAIRPRLNLINNIGFNKTATHTRTAGFGPSAPSEIDLPLEHPRMVAYNKSRDLQYVNKYLLNKKPRRKLFGLF